MAIGEILMTKLERKHFLTLHDYSEEEILTMLKMATELKQHIHDKQQQLPLKGKSLGMIFQKASTRTRVSFEVAM